MVQQRPSAALSGALLLACSCAGYQPWQQQTPPIAPWTQHTPVHRSHYGGQPTYPYPTAHAPTTRLLGLRSACRDEVIGSRRCNQCAHLVPCSRYDPPHVDPARSVVELEGAPVVASVNTFRIRTIDQCVRRRRACHHIVHVRPFCCVGGAASQVARAHALERKSSPHRTHMCTMQYRMKGRHSVCTHRLRQVRCANPRGACSHRRAVCARQPGKRGAGRYPPAWRIMY